MKKKIIFMILIPLLLGVIYKLLSQKKNNQFVSKTFLDAKINANTILIAEYERYHLECLPGYTKYFTDLGYNVDILILNGNKESMEKFQPNNKIRIFEFKNKKEIEDNYLKYQKQINKYKFSFLQTLNPSFIDFYKKIGYYNNSNSLFIIHHIDEIYIYGINNSISRDEVFSIADYGIIPYLNPNYFGNFRLTHKKNEIVSFFITSTKERNYEYFLKAVNYLSDQSIAFKINLIGRCGKFNKNNVPINLRKYFNFFGKVKYQKMYEIVNKSDFIILNLYPDREIDNLFKTYRSTGNSQLAYGFYKPVLIETNFVKVYKFSNETSIIYKDHDLSSAMLRAAKMSHEEYYDMSRKIKYLREIIYNNSLNNLIKVLKKNKLLN